MLDRPLYDEWLKRLRSGEWQQATHALCKIKLDHAFTDLPVEKRAYCCLGVLGQLMVEADLLTAHEVDCEVAYGSDDMQNDDPFVYLPEELIHMDVQRALGVANDMEGKNFCQIADLIESKYELAITNPPVVYEDADQRLGGHDA